MQYPSNLASDGLKQAMLEFLRSVGETNLEYFFYSLLDSMATEMNSGQTVAGYKFVLQLIGQNWPAICSHNMAKTALLRNSYQNRSNICLSILWAIGQGGHQDLTEGVKVWHNLMLPNLELKSFTKFVVEHIERVLIAAKARKEDLLGLNQNDFFTTYYILTGPNNNLPKEMQQSMKRSSFMLLVSGGGGGWGISVEYNYLLSLSFSRSKSSLPVRSNRPISSSLSYAILVPQM